MGERPPQPLLFPPPHPSSRVTEHLSSHVSCSSSLFPPAKGPAQKPRGRRGRKRRTDLSSRAWKARAAGRPALASSGPGTKQNKNKEECAAATVPQACRAWTRGRPLSVPAPAAVQPRHFADEKSRSRHIKLLTGCEGQNQDRPWCSDSPSRDVARPRETLRHEGCWEGVSVGWGGVPPASVLS